MKGLLTFIFIIGFITQAEAYIDPGSGMAFVSGIGAWIIAFFALVFGTISLTFKKWINGVKNIFSKVKNKFFPQN